MDHLERASKEDVGKQKSYRRYELLLEAAFAYHLSIPEVVQKPYDGKGHAFHLMINAEGGEGESSQVLDIVYLYAADGTPAAFRIDRLPKGWMVIFNPALEPSFVQLMQKRNAERGTPSDLTPRPITIGTVDAILVFDAMDPFSPFVLQSVLDELAPEPTPTKPKAKPAKAPARKPSPLDEVDPP
ncbi:hypothetical protein SAMN05443639_1021 [Stigmatella erecta]|uniref:Uncharacterized protein n=2 Tax=Stigmatella erecta TaxID=83460 RepID=A0A1I0C8A1_9BACT|nr:hypothetical protein SAMN05443639_1021 [Stigmatella erecta]